MDKRYQVFVSSTFADLKDERQKVIKTLMEMDCIPSGMELFPAMDEEQFEFIKKVIDDCDYYLLIIGARYGSLAIEGISYTEKEYDYAVQRGLKVVAFLHEDPDSLPVNKTDKDPALAERLANFRMKVTSGRLCKFWKTADQLPGLVSLSLQKTIKTYPAIGWMRANNVGTPELLAEIHALQAENKALREKVARGPQTDIADIADWDDRVVLMGSITAGGHVMRYWKRETTWSQTFLVIAPHLMEYSTDIKVQRLLAEFGAASEKVGSSYTRQIDGDIYQRVKIQFMAYGVVKVQNIQNTIYWLLSEYGTSQLLQLGAVRKQAPAPTLGQVLPPPATPA
ncbi:DUF4062 domain-containing protein [Cupriavidus pauculus]|uniref:DUF4062 domain-containing protein n=1 Tax=Cupriavidus pauculus TaxID=82633 RepID=UPI001EE328A9|nr:DUF4062 domain-containing protein [Cupriavidus pauculus]GJG98745.1 DUF4062 domain-containing protein [Cupriavidus pauculus]